MWLVVGVAAAAVENCLIIDGRTKQPGKGWATNVEMELLACVVSRKRYNRSGIEFWKKNNIVHNCHSRDQSYTALTTVCAFSRL